MGLFGNMAPQGMPTITAPQLPPDLQEMLAHGGATAMPQTGSQPIPQSSVAQPVGPQQSYPGLKRPPPAVGTAVNGYIYMGGDPRSRDPSVWKPAQGDDFLNSLPLDDTKKTLIKGIASYELPPGSQRGGLGSPEVQQLLGLAKQYDPSFNAQNYPAIQKTRTEIANPDSRFNLTKTALNTAIGHALGLAESAAALHNHQSPIVNSIGNNFERYVLGDPRQGNFEQNAELLSGEVVKAITGAQGGGVSDRKDQKDNYPVDGSPDQQNQAIGKTVDLLKSKLDEMSNTLRKAGNPNANALDVLSPTARDAWMKLSKQYGAGGTSSLGDGGKAPAKSALPNTASLPRIGGSKTVRFEDLP